jgi:uncharacterized protein DUF3617
MSMLKLKTFLSICCLAVIATPSLSAQARLKAGQWEYVATREGQTSTHTKCLTAAQADTVNGSDALIRAQLENAMGQKNSCKVMDLKVSASSMTSTIACGETTITNVLTFHGGETAENTMTTRAQGKEYVATMKMRRLGACTGNGD